MNTIMKKKLYLLSTVMMLNFENAWAMQEMKDVNDFKVKTTATQIKFSDNQKDTSTRLKKVEQKWDDFYSEKDSEGKEKKKRKEEKIDKIQKIEKMVKVITNQQEELNQFGSMFTQYYDNKLSDQDTKLSDYAKTFSEHKNELIQHEDSLKEFKSQLLEHGATLSKHRMKLKELEIEQFAQKKEILKIKIELLLELSKHTVTLHEHGDELGRHTVRLNEHNGKIKTLEDDFQGIKQDVKKNFEDQKEYKNIKYKIELNNNEINRLTYNKMDDFEQYIKDKYNEAQNKRKEKGYFSRTKEEQEEISRLENKQIQEKQFRLKQYIKINKLKEENESLKKELFGSTNSAPKPGPKGQPLN